MNPLALTSAIVAFAGWASYVPVNKVPSLRHTMWPTWALLSIAAALAVASLLGARVSADEALACGALLAVALFVAFFFVGLRIPPAAGRPEIGRVLPRFTVVSEDGRTLTPQELAGGGPTLLVFFRGFW